MLDIVDRVSDDGVWHVKRTDFRTLQLCLQLQLRIILTCAFRVKNNSHLLAFCTIYQEVVTLLVEWQILQTADWEAIGNSLDGHLVLTGTVHINIYLNSCFNRTLQRISQLVGKLGHLIITLNLWQVDKYDLTVDIQALLWNRIVLTTNSTLKFSRIQLQEHTTLDDHLLGKFLQRILIGIALTQLLKNVAVDQFGICLNQDILMDSD